MIELYSAQIDKIALHKVGNKYKGEHLIISDAELVTQEDEKLILKEYFLKPFREKEENYFCFHEESNQLGILNFIDDIFEGENFLETSRKMAKTLYNCSNHPHIKSGELFIVQFSDLIIDGNKVNAIGIFKSEIKQHFFKFKQTETNVLLSIEEGISAGKLDKGCLVFHTEKENGYKALLIDTNRYDTKYWSEDYLGLTPLADDNFFTKNYLKFCQNFAKKVVLPTEDKQQEVLFMNKAVNHFAKNDTFDETEFLEEAVENPNLVSEFHNYKNDVGLKYGIEDVSSFPIASTAVKEARKKIKNTIELDTNIQLKVNFSDTKLMEKYIEKGWDEEKQMYYYLVYFNDEIQK